MKPILPALAALTLAIPALAAPPKPAAPKSDPMPKSQPVGLPQDAAAHDATAAIEWWYFNAFIKTESGKNYAVVGSFFRTGLTATQKGHYLIYSLTDLDNNKVVADGSILDTANVNLLKTYLPLAALARPDDGQTMQLIAALQKNELPAPHRIAGGSTSLTAKPFRIGMDNESQVFAQQSADARRWSAKLSDPAFALNVTFDQPKATRPPMLVGGEGKTGLTKPDDMFYVSLTRPQVRGKLTVNGVEETVTGTGWIDRQWGRSWIVGDNGWDWFGVHLTNGEDLIVYRVKDNKTGKVLRAEATLQRLDGTQIVDKSVTFAATGTWLDPVSGIAFPQVFVVAMQNIGYTLNFTPTFDAQAVPTLGIGTAFWEGVVDVTGTTRNGVPLSGRGYRELVGYKPQAKPALSAKSGTIAAP
ncbi:MAG: hypothetical protein H7Y38_03505 [Armatimonadetes bacterium]|nr:hypothetical protein [Armatimonadota bacterium]